MMIFNVANFIINFTVFSTGVLMLSISFAICMVVVAVINNGVREWLEKR